MAAFSTTHNPCCSCGRDGKSLGISSVIVFPSLPFAQVGRGRQRSINFGLRLINFNNFLGSHDDLSPFGLPFWALRRSLLIKLNDHLSCGLVELKAYFLGRSWFAFPPPRKPTSIIILFLARTEILRRIRTADVALSASTLAQITAPSCRICTMRDRANCFNITKRLGS